MMDYLSDVTSVFPIFHCIVFFVFRSGIVLLLSFVSISKGFFVYYLSLDFMHPIDEHVFCPVVSLKSLCLSLLSVVLIV